MLRVGFVRMVLAMEKAVNVVRVHGGFCVNKSVLIRIDEDDAKEDDENIVNGLETNEKEYVSSWAQHLHANYPFVGVVNKRQLQKKRKSSIAEVAEVAEVNSEQLSLLQRVAGLLQIVLAGQKMNNVRRSQRRPSMKLINLQMNLEMEQMDMKKDSMLSSSSNASSTTSKVGTTIPPSIFSNSQSGGHWRRKSQGKFYIKILH